MKSFFKKFSYVSPVEKSASGHQAVYQGGREWEDLYRNRWSYDKVVRSTHGVNCTGSCSWNVFVKNGIVTWENQNHDYPETNPDMPDFEPRGCPRGASFSWYMYSPLRVKYPYIRGELADLWRAAKKEHTNGIEAWESIVTDPAKTKLYKSARGMGGFVRSTWEEASEITAASMLYTAKTYGPDRNFGFSPIPAMSMLSYAGGARFMNLMGGACLSFYDWYADLPPASPQVWGDQTDVPESSDWYNAGYIMTWGSNVPQTRTPDAHFLTEVRYKGTKVISVSPDYAESTTAADTWLNVKAGSDGALAMAMGHVILNEYYVKQTVPMFEDYAKHYTDFPFLVMLTEEEGNLVPDRFLTAKDMGDGSEKSEFKYYVIDAKTKELAIPNGVMGHRWTAKEKWNLRQENSETGEELAVDLSILDAYKGSTKATYERDVQVVHKDDIETVRADGFQAVSTGDNEDGVSKAKEADAVRFIALPMFGHLDEKQVVERAVPVRKIQTAAGERLVTTVFDLILANYGVDRGLGGEVGSSYEIDTPFTPAWQEKYTGIDPQMVIHTAKEFADNAIATDGRSMIIMGGGINHWFHADVIYRAVLNLVLFCGCEGKNGGGWAHYVGQEKLRPAEGWGAIMSAKDWQAAPRLQNSTSFFYFSTDQWRTDEMDTKELTSPLKSPKYRHAGDYNVLAARLGWLPSYPTFNKGSEQIFADAKAAGHEAFDEVKQYVANKLKAKELQFAVEDPDAPENFPRNLIVWRANLITSSSKGHEYFMKYLLGTKDGLLEANDSPSKPSEIKWREQAGEGKLDLLVDLDFRMAGSALYSDIVLPTATWYEKTDLSSTDMHPFVHPFQPAVNPGWEAKTDWDIFLTLGKAVSKLAKEANLPVYRDIVAVPLQHDSEAETAQPLGKIRDWSRGECDPIPGKTMPQLIEIERDYTQIYNKQRALGPNLANGSVGAHGIAVSIGEEYESLKLRNGVITEPGVGAGCPSIEDCYDACQAVLTMSSATNGAVAHKSWSKAEELTGLTNLKDMTSGRAGEKITFEDIVAQPRLVIPTPIFTGNGKDNRRYTPFTNNIELLMPFRTVTGRQSFFLDHELMGEWGEQMATFKPILAYAPMSEALPADGTPEITLKYLTPHNKWSIHSMYFDTPQMLTLFRGGQSVWLNEDDANEIGVADNDWIELYNSNGVVASRAVVTPRIPRGVAYMHHAQDRHINVPGTSLTGGRGGTHNTPTRLHMKPTHMIGGYGQLSYGFNYYGPTGNQRDVLVVVRKMKEVNWLED